MDTKTLILIPVAALFLATGYIMYTPAPGSVEADVNPEDYRLVDEEPLPTEKSSDNTSNKVTISSNDSKEETEEAPDPSAVGSERPSRLLIPKLGIDAHVQHLGVTESGLMAAPKNFTDVSWYKYGYVPGQTGSAVMAGHEDNAVSLDGVFKHLKDLNIGDDVYIRDGLGNKLHFRVIKKEIVPYNLSGAKLESIFTRSDGKYLNLITCDGDWLPEAKTNDKRLIVYTELVE